MPGTAIGLGALEESELETRQTRAGLSLWGGHAGPAPDGVDHGGGRSEALRSPARAYVGMSYRVEDERLEHLLPLALRPWQGQVERELLAGGVKRSS